MHQALLSRMGMGGPVVMSSVGRPSLKNLGNGHTALRCPFLKAAESLSAPAIPALVQQFKAYCPFLRSTTQPIEEARQTAPSAPLIPMANTPYQLSQEALMRDVAPHYNTPIPHKNRPAEIYRAPKLKPTSLDAKAPRASVQTADEECNSLMKEKIDQLKKEGRYREFFAIERKAGDYPRALRHGKGILNPEEVVSFCSNDYLAMGQNPVVVNAMKSVLEKNGAGAGGTRNISGTTPHHTRLEEEIADLHQTESSLVFTSCFVANDSSISTLAKLLPNCQIFSDADNHSSLIEGVRHSGCAKHIFRHNDVAHLEELLAKVDPSFPKLIVFESVYSMDGDIAPIKEICDAADKYNALTFCDEVHAVGLYGATGAGVAQQRGIGHRLSMISGTLAKGYGVFGGYIAGSSMMIDAVRSFAPGFIFTSSLPPAVAAGAAASIRYLKDNDGERMRHQERAAQLKDMLKAKNIPYMHSESHIVPVMICDPNLCKQAADLLLNKHKIYVQPINFPTVPRGTERLRFTPGPMHTVEMLEDLSNALAEVFEELQIDKTAALAHC